MAKSLRNNLALIRKKIGVPSGQLKLLETRIMSQEVIEIKHGFNHSDGSKLDDKVFNRCALLHCMIKWFHTSQQRSPRLYTPSIYPFNFQSTQRWNPGGCLPDGSHPFSIELCIGVYVCTLAGWTS